MSKEAEAMAKRLGARLIDGPDPLAPSAEMQALQQHGMWPPANFVQQINQVAGKAPDTRFVVDVSRFTPDTLAKMKLPPNVHPLMFLDAKYNPLYNESADIAKYPRTLAGDGKLAGPTPVTFIVTEIQTLLNNPALLNDAVIYVDDGEIYEQLRSLPEENLAHANLEFAENMDEDKKKQFEDMVEDAQTFVEMQDEATAIHQSKL